MNSALVALQKLLWFLNFWNAAASGTIPAAGPGSSVEVPTQGTVPGWLRKGELFLPSRQGHADKSSSVHLRALGWFWWQLELGAVLWAGRRHWDHPSITCCLQALTAELCEQELRAGGAEPSISDNSPNTEEGQEHKITDFTESTESQNSQIDKFTGSQNSQIHKIHRIHRITGA